VPERTLAREARAAIEPDGNYGLAIGQRRREVGGRRSVDRDDLGAGRGGDVHQPRVIRHGGACQRQDIHGLFQQGLAAQVDDTITATRANLLTDLVLALRPEHDDGHIERHQFGSEFAEVVERPAFRWTIGGSRHQRHDGTAVGRQPRCKPRTVIRVDRQLGVWRGRQLGVGRHAERDETLDGLVQAIPVESPHVVQQPVPHFAPKAGAPGNAGEERDQRGLE